LRRLTFSEVVLQGSSGEHDAASRLDLAHGLGQGRLVVLENVPLVTHHQVWP